VIGKQGGQFHIGEGEGLRELQHDQSGWIA
jgi:hypothetical protein